jgi:hypothetical protein
MLSPVNSRSRTEASTSALEDWVAAQAAIVPGCANAPGSASISDTHRACTPSAIPARLPAASEASHTATDPPRTRPRTPPRINDVGVFPTPPFGLATAIRTDRGQVADRINRSC